MSQHSVIRTLRAVPLFRSLSGREIESLAHALRRRKYQKGEYLIVEGTQGSEFYVISEGLVCVTKNTPNGPIQIGKFTSGSYLGEIALVTSDKRTASAYAETDVEVFVLGAKEFRTLFSSLLSKLQESASQKKQADDVREQSQVNDKIKLLEIDQLDTIALLGTGVLGRVTLVRDKTTHDVYALKVYLFNIRQ